MRREDRPAAIEAGFLRPSAHAGAAEDAPRSALSQKLRDDLARIAQGARQHAILRDPDLLIDLLAYQLSHALRWEKPLGLSTEDVPNWPSTEASGYQLDARLTDNPARDMFGKDHAKSFRAFRKKGADTPEYECAQCATSMIGRWQEDTQEYRTPSLCDDCRRNLSKCADCRRPKAPENLRDGRCWECNRRRDYGACSNCGREIPSKYLLDGRCSNCRPVACRDCATATSKAALTYGRCPACAKKAAELNPTRLCVDCRQPFITRDHEAWFRSRSLDIPKAHQAIRKQCPPRPPSTSKPLRASAPARTATKARPPKKGLLERLLGWLNP